MDSLHVKRSIDNFLEEFDDEYSSETLIKSSKLNPYQRR